MDILEKRPTWNATAQAGQPVPVARSPRPHADLSWVVPILCASSVVMLVAILLRLLMAVLGSGPHRPACTPAVTWLQTITQQEQQAQWQIAATNARTALTTARLCPTDRTALATKMVADGLEGLYATAFDPRDVTAQQQEIAAYHALASQAHGYGVPFPSSLQVAQRGYQSGQFLLTKSALEDAYRTGQVTTANQSMLQLYSSSIYNLGYWWTVQGQPAVYQAGLHLLALSHALDSCYRLGSGTAFATLQRLAGADPQHWPTPAPSPLLAACIGSTQTHPQPIHRAQRRMLPITKEHHDVRAQ